MELSNETLTDKITTFIQTNTEEHQTFMKKQNDTNNRVKKLELWRSAIIGGLAVVSCMIGGGLVTFILSYFLP